MMGCRVQAARAMTSLIACAALVGCATEARRDEARSVALIAAPVNAGETGRATLIPLGDRTQVTITVSGVPPDLVSLPVHLYTFIYRGSCGNLAPQPTYALTERTLGQSATSGAIAASRVPVTLTNVAPISIGALFGEPYAIRIMTSPADGNREIFCGDIR